MGNNSGELNTGTGSKNNTTEWDKLAETVAANNPALANNPGEKTPSEENPSEETPTEENVTSKEEQLVKFLSQAKESAISVEGAAEKGQSELVEFGTAKIPREFLGEEKVVVSEFRDRSRFDFRGRRKDKKDLNRLLNDWDYNEEEFKKLFTPTVAKLFLDKMDEDKTGEYLWRGRPYGRLFEALPIEVQLQKLSKKENLAKFCNNARNVGDGLVTKLACGLINNLSGPEDGRIDNAQLSNIIEGQIRNREKWTRRAMFKSLSQETSRELFEAASNNGFKKLDCAMAFLSGEDLFDNIGSIMDRQVSTRDANVFKAAIENPFIGGAKEEWQAKYREHFPPEIRSLAEAGISLIYEKGNVVEREMALGKEMESTREIREEIGLDKIYWFKLMRIAPVLYGQIKANQPLDEDIRASIKFYAEYGEDSSQYFGGEDKAVTLESLKDIDKLYPAIARGNLDVGDAERAREVIGYFAFGMGAEEIAQILISVGAVKVKRSEEYNEFEHRFDECIDKIRAKKDMPAFGELSEDQKLLILDSISLLGCRDNELEEKLKVYEQRHSSAGERTKFRHLMAEAKDRMSEKVSKIYGERMQKSIETCTKKVDELEYEGKKIPVLNMENRNFFLLVHRLGAYYSKDQTNPAQWNDDSQLTDDEKEIGYISTSAIAGGSLKLAAIPGDNLGDPNEVFYGFSKLGDKSIKTMSTKDLSTSVVMVNRGYKEGNAMELKTMRQDVFYEDPDKLIKDTEKEESSYSEVVLDRYSGNPNEHGGRLQPSEIIVFADDPSKIGDLAKKHAAYFGVPILMIDSKKHK